MIAKSLLIGFIAFDGAALGGAPVAFPAQDPIAGPVFGNRNFSGFKTAAAGSYALRLGGPVLTSGTTPPQVANEWSRGPGNQKVTVTLGHAQPRVAATYNLIRLDDNTWSLFTYEAGALADFDLIQVSVEALIT